MIETWEDEQLGLHMNVLRGIYGLGFETPSPIQKQAILPIIKGGEMAVAAPISRI